MCGIAGFFGLKNDPKVNIDHMLSQIVHRGPDASGVWIDPTDTGVTFGHRRLSIIDLTETGSQPMISHSRRYVICYNGEIYNHSYVLEQLRADGYTDEMYGTSDTEILLEAMDHFGPVRAVQMCKGMFAIALYDRQEETLILFRDRIGEKPLYYGLIGGGFAFASEIGALKALDEFDNPINTDVLGIYLMHGYIPAPYSIYRNIWKIEPGTWLKIKCRINKNHAAPEQALEKFSPESDTFWSLTDVAVRGQADPFRGSREEAADELERLLSDSIRDQMIADVPLGAFLSSGIDSSTVVSLMQSLSDRPVRTFTIGFDNEKFNEADAAADIAKHLGTEHTQLYITKQDALDVIPKIPGMFGEPFGDVSQIPTYLVSKLTREHVTVSLSGDGGDELFGGYGTYAGLESIWNRINRIPQSVRRPAGALMRNIPLGGDSGRAMKFRGAMMGAGSLADLYRREFEADPIVKLLPGANKADRQRMLTLPYKYTEMDPHLMKDVYHSAMLMDMRMYHVDDILVKVDRTAMAVSLESRVPMLDRDVVEFAWTLPTDYLRNDKQGKLVLRDVLYRHVPREMMERPKKGFSVPIMEWLLEPEMKEWAENLLNPNSINRQGILNAKAVKRLWSEYTEQGAWRQTVWYVLMLQSWLKEQGM